ncbi:MAG: M23 family metallopeptidase, partial [Actinomycetes bacterium]
KARPHRLHVRVPSGARSGPLKVISSTAGAALSETALKVAAAEQPTAVSAPPTADGGVFPVSGPHDFGTATNGFGGGRAHKGQDIFARCGVPVVAALSGKVTIARWQDRAGNYVVIKAADGTSQAYMHLLKPATVSKGTQVRAGQQIGQVGQTGRASGCHLHFELWTAPGWYAGGEPTDPLPSLRRWASPAKR